MKILHWLVRIVCVVGLFLWFVWIVDQNIAFGGYKAINYVFGDPGPVVSELQPVSRVGGKELGSNGASFQKMFEDPVYFDVITPVTYQRTKVSLVFANHSTFPLRLGVKGENSADFLLYDTIRDIQMGEWETGHVDIDLSSAGWEKGKYRFVISVPGLVRGNTEQYIALSSVNVQLYKEPVTSANIKTVMRRVINGFFK